MAETITRIEALEKSNRRLKALLTCISLCCGAAVVMGAQAAVKDVEVRNLKAQTVIVEDRQGGVKSPLGLFEIVKCKTVFCDELLRIQKIGFVDKDDKVRAQLGYDEETTMLILSSPNKENELVFSVGNEGCHLQVDVKGKQVVFMNLKDLQRSATNR